MVLFNMPKIKVKTLIKRGNKRAKAEGKGKSTPTASTQKGTYWCDHCQVSSHSTDYCRSKIAFDNAYAKGAKGALRARQKGVAKAGAMAIFLAITQARTPTLPLRPNLTLHLNRDPARDGDLARVGTRKTLCSCFIMRIHIPMILLLFLNVPRCHYPCLVLMLCQMISNSQHHI